MSHTLIYTPSVHLIPLRGKDAQRVCTGGIDGVYRVCTGSILYPPQKGPPKKVSEHSRQPPPPHLLVCLLLLLRRRDVLPRPPDPSLLPGSDAPCGRPSAVLVTPVLSSWMSPSFFFFEKSVVRTRLKTDKKNKKSHVYSIILTELRRVGYVYTGFVVVFHILL